jgi:hypothetical protein
MQTKKFSPQAIIALKDALSVVYWRKEELQDFLKVAIANSTIISTINWSGTKRESIKELVERMLNRQDIYGEDLLNLIHAVSDITNFSHLEYWDDDKTKIKKAKEAVSNLRALTKGHFDQTREQEESQKRRMATEQLINKNKSLDSDIQQLKDLFNKIAIGTDFQKRGYDLEKFLYQLFSLYDLAPKGSFKNYGEQIDGAFTFDNMDFLLEAKWKSEVNQGELAIFCQKVESKFKSTCGLFVTIDGVTKEAISPHFKSIIIMDGSDIMAVLEGRISFPDLLFKKRRKASESGNIYVPFHKL